MQIRLIENLDYHSWTDIWLNYQEFFQLKFTEEEINATWSKIMNPNVCIYAAGCFIDEQIVGLVHFIIHPTTLSFKDYCYMKDLFVNSSFRGKGIGSSLVAFLKEEAMRRDCSRLYWHVHGNNEQAITMYDKIIPSGGLVYRISL